MAGMGKKQTTVHKVFLGLKKPYDPTEVYSEMCKLVGLKDDSIERGLGKLFREGKLKPPVERPRKIKRPSRAPREGDDFR